MINKTVKYSGIEVIVNALRYFLDRWLCVNVMQFMEVLDKLNDSSRGPTGLLQIFNNQGYSDYLVVYLRYHHYLHVLEIFLFR